MRAKFVTRIFIKINVSCRVKSDTGKYTVVDRCDPLQEAMTPLKTEKFLPLVKFPDRQGLGVGKCAEGIVEADRLRVCKNVARGPFRRVRAGLTRQLLVPVNQLRFGG